MLERKMKTAAIPPPLSDVTVRPICYYHVKDPMKIWKVEDRTSQGFNEEEKTEFRKRFKQYSKSFDAAACFLLNKSASDCVKYYNFNKHAEDLVAIKKGKKPAHPTNCQSTDKRCAEQEFQYYIAATSIQYDVKHLVGSSDTLNTPVHL
ncbi:Myb-like DNA-binding domain protein [Trichuris suis]|nr:Myb-like DNA-binding domain protein [Trichuris suis]